MFQRSEGHVYHARSEGHACHARGSGVDYQTGCNGPDERVPSKVGGACLSCRGSGMDNQTLRNGRDKRVPPRFSGPDKRVPPILLIASTCKPSAHTMVRDTRQRRAMQNFAQLVPFH